MRLRSAWGSAMDRVDYQTLIIQDVSNLHKRDELNLRPWYQRRVVWTPQQQAYLINTVHEQKPIPSIYIRHTIDVKSGKSIREVVDGQQRLTAIIEYVADKFAARHPRHDRPVKFTDLRPKEKQQFLTTSLSVGYLLGASDRDVIEIFGRINSVSKNLSPQEKRNARFGGEFKQFCLRQGSQRVDFWRGAHIFTALRIARMEEVQLIAELAMNMLEGLQDYDPKKIDAFYRKYDREFPMGEDLERRFDKIFGVLVSLSDSLLKDTIFHRPPILFSLFLLLDKMKVKVPDLEKVITEIDTRFNGDREDKTKEDNAFYVACRSNQHRITSRKIRETYIGTFLL